MQVEYDSSDMPPPKILPAQSQDNSEEEDEAEEGEEAQSAKKDKPKRIIKQRQSLAEKQRGTTMFPLSRVKKIIKADKDLDMMTSEATFMIAVATEYFIKHFMEEGYTKARLDRRRIVNYKDMAAVVARSEEFDFLRDVLPMPMPMSEALELRKQKMMVDENPTLLEDMPPQPGEQPEDNLPPLALSTNPLYPNAIVKRPPNTHAKTSTKPKPAPADAKDSKDSKTGTPKAAATKTAPTRGSARRSIVHSEADSERDAVRAEQDSAHRGTSEAVASEAEERMDVD